MQTYKIVTSDYEVHYQQASDLHAALSAYWVGGEDRSVTDVVSISRAPQPDEDRLVSGDLTTLIEDAKRLLAGCFTPEPWEVECDSDGDPIHDTFDGYSIWYYDGQPGTMYVCKGFEQGSDEGLGDARFVEAAPMLVRRLVAEIERLRAVPQEPDWLQRKYGADA